MAKFIIEKNVPVPPLPAKKRKYPFDKMEVGESFFHKKDEDDEVTLKDLQMRLNNAACNYSRTHDKTKKFRTNRQKTGVRIWRIK